MHAQSQPGRTACVVTLPDYEPGCEANRLSAGRDLIFAELAGKCEKQLAVGGTHPFEGLDQPADGL